MTHSTEEQTGALHPWIKEGADTIRVGIQFLDPFTDWQQFHERVLAAEELGVDSIWISDHPTLVADCWNTLSALATTTTRIRLGSLVSCVFYRHPVLLARLALDVDRWSGGRLVVGLGIGDIPAEFQQLGLPYLPVSQRQEYLEETIQVLKGLWQGQPFTFQGKHLQIQAHLHPGAVQQPYIPLLIAGGGERVTLRQVAQYADVSNFGAHSFTGGAAQLDDVKRKLRILQDYCQTFGRAPHAVMQSHITIPLFLGKSQVALDRKFQALPPPVQQIFKTHMVALQPEQAISYFQGLIDAGMTYFIVGLGLRDRETLELLQKEVLPALTLPRNP